MWKDVALVALGGAAGAVTRFGVSTWLPTREFPWATLLVNLVGSLALGFLILPGGMEHQTRLLVAVGFLGALTTLSTFSVETVDALRVGQTAAAATAFLANGLGGPLMALAGWKLAVMLGYPGAPRIP